MTHHTMSVHDRYDVGRTFADAAETRARRVDAADDYSTSPAADPHDSHFVMTTRTASWLFSCACVLARSAHSDARTHCDHPVDATRSWLIFDLLPPETYRQNAAWRRRMAETFEQLARDLDRRRIPYPRCVAERHAVSLMIDVCRSIDTTADDDQADAGRDGRASGHDRDWEHLLDILLRNRVRTAPDTAAYLRPVDTTVTGPVDPELWFTPFDDTTPRDPGRTSGGRDGSWTD